MTRGGKRGKVQKTRTDFSTLSTALGNPGKKRPDFHIPTATTAANHRPAKRRTEPAYAAQTALGRRICVLKNHLTRHRCFRDGYQPRRSPALQDFQQAFERFAGALERVPVLAAIVRLERHGSAVLILLDGFELASPVDEAPADGGPGQFAGSRISLDVLDVHVGEEPAHFLVAARIGDLAEHRRITRVPVAAQ